MKLENITLIRSIARGGHAEIFLARALAEDGSEKTIACKRIPSEMMQDAEFLASLHKEVRIGQILHHPNILQVYGLCEDGDCSLLEMEYMDAGDMQKLQKRCALCGIKMPVSMAIYMVTQVAAGLHCAHELLDENGEPLELVHRDISPENILFNLEGEIKISDFGIAQIRTDTESEASDYIEGKFNYMSPEQAWGDRLDRRSDIFSLGVVLYEALLGVSMYPNDDPDAILMCARVGNFPQPHEVDGEFPGDLEKILMRALDLDKKVRYGTMLEFSRDLESCALSHGWKISREDWRSWMNSLA